MIDGPNQSHADKRFDAISARGVIPRVDGEKNLKLRSAGRESERDFGRLPSCLLFLFYVTILIPSFAPLNGQAPAVPNPAERLVDPLAQWEGLPVRRIEFEGVAADRLTSISGHLPQLEGSPLLRADVAASLRELYATGLFENIEAAGQREGDGVALIFRGTSRTFIGVVTVDGAKGPTVNTQLERASRLNSGTRLSEGKMPQALDTMRQVMAENGFHE